MNSHADSIFSMLTGRELAFITFIRDYIQFGFDGPLLNVFTDPVLVIGGATYRRGDPGFYSAMVEVIGTRVTGADLLDENEIKLMFSGGAVITVPLRGEDIKFGAEAALFYTDFPGGAWSVWPKRERPKRQA